MFNDEDGKHLTYLDSLLRLIYLSIAIWDGLLVIWYTLKNGNNQWFFQQITIYVFRFTFKWSPDSWSPDKIDRLKVD